MLRSVNELYNYVLHAKDGEIGRCKDFLFDDRFWTIRYMVADTGKWLPRRRVLVSPISLGEPNWDSKLFPVRLSKKQIEEAPELDEEAPVSRQKEAEWVRYYDWPHYWSGPGVWETEDSPNALFIQKQLEEAEEEAEGADMHLRATKEVNGYHIDATDGKIGHVEDFIVDDQAWTIRYVVVDTRNWLPGPKVLLSPDWVQSVSWLDREVSVGVTIQEVKDSPGYDPGTPVNREYEVRLYDFFGRPKYWE
jgi:hypothetical protein